MIRSAANQIRSGLLCLFRTASLGSLLFLGQACSTGGNSPTWVYLTWQGDTGTTMTVNYQTREAASSVVFYDTKSGGGDPKRYSQRAEGSAHQIEGLNDGRWIHWVELTGLDPGQTYYFVSGDLKSGHSKERKFRTITADGSPIRFVAGGDMGFDDVVPEMMRLAARQDPQFALIGGDIAYADGDLNKVAVWDTWFNRWTQKMITPGGYTIPMVLAIGNHEVKGYFGSVDDAPFYFAFFAQNGYRPYYRRTFGNYLALYVLDTHHVTPVDDTKQTKWLEQVLKADSQFEQKVAAYHIGLFPSYTAYANPLTIVLRKNWMPLFDKYSLDVAFEHHDHTFKRSHRLKGGLRSPDGVVYLGDGAWGRGRGDAMPGGREYLAKSENRLHFWICEANPNSMRFKAMDNAGMVFDSLTLTDTNEE